MIFSSFIYEGKNTLQFVKSNKGKIKGGVVNCKCAIENPGLIDTIINVGTPHEIEVKS